MTANDANPTAQSTTGSTDRAVEGAIETVNLWRDRAWAKRYLDDRDRIPHRREGLAVLLELVGTNARNVLDLGTGDGSTLALVLAANPGASGVGLDFSTEMLQRAGTHFAGDDRVRLVRHDLDESLPPGSFDTVVSSFAIHHCVDERKAAIYAEVFARLEPGGVFVNLEHVASPTVRLHEEFLAALGKTLADDDPSNKLAPVEAQVSWLRAAGFDDADCYWKWRELAVLAGRRSR